MDIRVLKQLFENGALQSAIIAPAPMSEQWMIFVRTTKGVQEPLTTVNARKEKLFKRIPAALEDVRRIGFKEAVVSLPSEDVPIRK